MTTTQKPTPKRKPTTGRASKSKVEAAKPFFTWRDLLRLMPNKSHIVSLDYMVFDKSGTASVTDLEISARCPVDFKVQDCCMIDKKTLKAIPKSERITKIDVDAKNQKVVIHLSNGVKIKTKDGYRDHHEDYPTTLRNLGEKGWKVVAEFDQETIDKIKHITPLPSKDGLKASLTTINVGPSHIVATDAAMMGWYNGKTGVKGKNEIEIHPKAFSRLLPGKISKNSKHGRYVIENGKYQLGFPRLDYRYPDWKAVIPALSGEMGKVVIPDHKEFIKTIQFLKPFFDSAANRIIFNISPKAKEIKVTHDEGDGVEVSKEFKARTSGIASAKKGFVFGMNGMLLTELLKTIPMKKEGTKQVGQKVTFHLFGTQKAIRLTSENGEKRIIMPVLINGTETQY